MTAIVCRAQAGSVPHLMDYKPNRALALVQLARAAIKIGEMALSVTACQRRGHQAFEGRDAVGHTQCGFAHEAGRW